MYRKKQRSNNRHHKFNFIYVKDKDLNYQDCNQSLPLILNKKSRSDIIGKNDFQIGIREICARNISRQDQKVFETKTTSINNIQLIVTNEKNKNLNYPYVIFGETKPIFDAENQVSAIVGYYRNIRCSESNIIDKFFSKIDKKRFYLLPGGMYYLTRAEARFLMHWLTLPTNNKLTALGERLGLTASSTYSYARNIKEKLSIDENETIYEAVSRTIFYDELETTSH